MTLCLPSSSLFPFLLLILTSPSFSLSLSLSLSLSARERPFSLSHSIWPSLPSVPARLLLIECMIHTRSQSQSQEESERGERKRATAKAGYIDAELRMKELCSQADTATRSHRLHPNVNMGRSESETREETTASEKTNITRGDVVQDRLFINCRYCSAAVHSLIYDLPADMLTLLLPSVSSS